MTYLFEDFELDIQKRLLYKNGKILPLQTKVFETLLYLVENRENVVTKDELLENIWHNKFVEEGNLSQKIFTIRRVLGEKKEEHRFVVTVPGEGYIFVAPVKEKEAKTDLVATKMNGQYPRTVSKKKSLAVLPFTEISPTDKPQNSFLGFGLADSLTTNLFNYQDINIRSSQAVIKFADNTSDLKKIAAELQVNFLITGFVQKVDDNLKISVQLVSFPNEMAIWAGSWGISFSNLLTVQSAISEEIAKVLTLVIKKEVNPLSNSDTDNYEAYLDYIKGCYYWNTRTVEGLKQAINYANHALSLDPTFAKAYVGLADSYILLAGQHNYLSPKEAFPKAKASALKALELCPELAEAFTSLGFIAYMFDQDWNSAENYFQQAIKLNPNYPTAFHWYGEALASRGEFKKAVHFLNRAKELDPLSLPISLDLVETYFYAQKYNECEKQLKRIIDVNPQYTRSFFLYGLIYRETGKLKQAIEKFEKALTLSPQDSSILAELSYTYALLGNTKSAHQILSKLLEIRAEHYTSALNISAIYFALGDNLTAQIWRQKAIDEKDIWLVWAKVFKKFDFYREELKQTDLF